MNKTYKNNIDLFKGGIVVCLCASLIASQTCAIHGQQVDGLDSFGYVSVNASGTASNGTVYGPASYNWTPVSGPIPEMEMALNYGGYVKEFKGEIRNG